MSVLDKILEFLKDGKWHTVKEINEEAEFQEDKLEEILGFFAEYRLILLDKERKKAKLTSPVLKFLTKFTRQTEKANRKVKV